jgi:YD repeat-containing protein
VDAVGNVLSEADGLGDTTTYVYDKLDRPTEVHDPLNHVSSLAYDAVSNLTGVTDPLGKVSQLGYDARNRPVSATDPLGHTQGTVLDADGNTVGVIDGVGDLTRYAFDPLDRPVASLDGRGALSRTRYDAVDNPTAVTDPVGNTAQFLSDGLKRRVREIDPTGMVVTSAYDAASRLTQVIDRLGRQDLYSYDAADRLTQVTWKSAGGATVNTLDYTYDAANNLLTAGDNAGTYTRSYDTLNRLTAQTDVFGLGLTFSYDAADRRTLVQDSKGGLLTSAYDAASRLTTRELGGSVATPARVDLAYTARDQLMLEEITMTPHPTRRGLLGGLVASVLGLLPGARRQAAAAAPAPPRCPHYHDGLLWCAGQPGQTGYYVRDGQGCPYCAGPAPGACPPGATLPPVATFSYEGPSLTLTTYLGGSQTSVAYDGRGRRPPG